MIGLTRFLGGKTCPEAWCDDPVQQKAIRPFLKVRIAFLYKPKRLYAHTGKRAGSQGLAATSQTCAWHQLAGADAGGVTITVVPLPVLPVAPVAP